MNIPFRAVVVASFYYMGIRGHTELSPEKHSSGYANMEIFVSFCYIVCSGCLGKATGVLVRGTGIWGLINIDSIEVEGGV